MSDLSGELAYFPSRDLFVDTRTVTDQPSTGYLPLSDAAEYLGVSERLLQREVQHRRLAAFKPCRGVLRFRAEDLDEWMMRGRIEATAPTLAELEVTMRPMQARRRSTRRSA